jgi:hypothetical protein
MAKKEFEKTERGWKLYAKFVDKYGSEIRVQESSIVGRPCVWIFADNDPKVFEKPKPHLTVENAKQLIEALQSFVEDAESDDNWRNDSDYIEAWG